ncbi:MAG: ester cyclase [Nocardioides sp.]
MSDAMNLMTRLLKEGFETGDTTVCDEVLSDDFVEHQFGAAAQGEEARENVKAMIRDLNQMAPDVHFEVEDSVEAGDTAWARMTVTGTNTGPLFGRPSTGRPFTITVFDAVRVADGKVVEHWGVPDRFAMLVQTGGLSRP